MITGISNKRAFFKKGVIYLNLTDKLVECYNNRGTMIITIANEDLILNTTINFDLPGSYIDDDYTIYTNNTIFSFKAYGFIGDEDENQYLSEDENITIAFT